MSRFLRGIARRRAALLLIAGVTAALIPLSAETRQGLPEDVVDAYHDTLLKVMQNAEALGYNGRFKTLAPVVAETFDMRFIAGASVGKVWKDLNADQREELVSAFTDLSVATYAARFDGYSGEKFRIVDSGETTRGSMLVKTEIVKSDGDAVPIDYLLRDRTGEWRVVDVFLKGTISEVATRRADFSAVLKDDGFDGLLIAIHDKVAALAKP